MKAFDTVRLPMPAAGTRRCLGLALALLLHLLLLAGAGGGIGLPAASTTRPAPVVSVSIAVTAPTESMQLLPTVAEARSGVPAATPAPAPRAALPRRRTARAAQPPTTLATAQGAAVSTSQVDAVETTAALLAPAGNASGDAAVQSSLSEPAIESTGAPAAAAAPTTTPPAPAAPAAPAAPTATTDATAPTSTTAPPPRYQVSLPPSATLSYEVRYATRGNVTLGSSTVEWRNGAGGYAIHGEVSKFGFTLSAFRSEGMIDDAGIAPVLYAEKNARRAETNTHFLRDARQAISFSAATDSFPLQPGTQDRASIPWQLAGIARGQRGLLAPGAVLDVLVAGVRDAERWKIEVIGEETVDLDTGAARVWHLVRAPRSGTHDKRIDIWLAPAQQWYPVKLRYTEQSGDTLDLSMSALR